LDNDCGNPDRNGRTSEVENVYSGAKHKQQSMKFPFEKQPDLSRPIGHLKRPLIWLGVASALIVIDPSAKAATLQVKPGGAAGTYSTIGAAVLRAQSDYTDNGTVDTIEVAPGTYMESVKIETPVSLVGTGNGKSIINAHGLANGIYIDGIDAPKPRLSDVLVTGFTIENAQFEGIYITNASSITVADNEVLNNDQGLASGSCPGLPAFETNEGDDCGEGIHLSGVDHSTVRDNVSANNSGGILLSDDTGATHDNLITGNNVRNNVSDCGITLASHTPASLTGSTTPLGVFHNVIAENESIRNGTAAGGSGAGIGIFASVPGAQAYGNVVINNQIRKNGLPGLAMHSHTPGQILNDNMIVGNQISGNGADNGDAATPGHTGINVFGVSTVTGTVISGNSIEGEDDDIVTNTPGEIAIHFNNLLGGKLGVNNLGSGSVDATENWWGSGKGAGASGATSIGGSGIIFDPFLTSPVSEVQD
jgi:parallel beta-helix repeat protein